MQLTLHTAPHPVALPQPVRPAVPAPQPSQEDRVLTKRLVDAGKLLGIALLDHLILGDGTETYFSFADEQLL
jgi:DNA repair protein RadC